MRYCYKSVKPVLLVQPPCRRYMQKGLPRRQKHRDIILREQQIGRGYGQHPLTVPQILCLVQRLLVRVILPRENYLSPSTLARLAQASLDE